jgi:hypothetical protein
MDGVDWLIGELASLGCASCGQAYGEERVQLLAQREELFFVDLACGHCGSQAVAIVTVQVDDEGRRADAGELVKAGPLERPPVSADDVLDVHALLAGFQGSPRDLLARLDGKVP